MKRKYSSLVALAALAAMTLTGCIPSPVDIIDAYAAASEYEYFLPSGELSSGNTDLELPDNYVHAALSGVRGTMLSLSGDRLSIKRLSRGGDKPMGDAGVWTVFVYLCGTDLESDGGSATRDLIEMQHATAVQPDLRFIVEADGTYKWKNDLCENGTKKRLYIANGYTDVVYSGSSKGMGRADTLADFLVWGISNYASQYMALDLWNHGGGSITGVCFDETDDNDSLTLEEIDRALNTAYGFMTDRFEIIGCDACLMATAEFANILVPYARYMVCSQNVESGYGWDYGSFAEALGDGRSSGADIGRYICDSYYEACEHSREDEEATMSVVDLGKLDDFLKAFDLYAQDIYEYAGNGGLTDVLRAGRKALNFGGNNRTEGYTNMVDLKELLQHTEPFSSNAQDAFNKLEACVVSVVNGYDFQNAGGLSIYFPLSVRGSSELNIFRNICVSPYYLSLVDLCAYGSDSMGDINGFDFGSWLGSDSGFWSGGILDGYDFGYWDDEESSSLNFDGSDTAISYAVEPALSSDGVYSFQLTQDSLENLDTVYCNVMMSYYDDDGTEYMLDLGTDDYVDMDRDTGECCDNFSGYWFALPDGQPLCVYLSEVCFNSLDDYYNLYTAPISLNGKVTNLRIKQSYSLGGMTTEILGVWDGIDEYGSASRDISQLQNGDRICPVYPVYDIDTGDYVFDYYGDDYVYDGNSRIDEELLYEGDYYYAFQIYDIYDNALYTDFVLFGVDSDGSLYYYE